jgi:hypothetical protein
VGERQVPYVVAEHRQAHRPAHPLAAVGAQVDLLEGGVEDPRGRVHGAQGVGVAGVRRSGEGQVAEAQRAHVAQALEEAAVDDGLLGVVDEDGPVDGIADAHRAGGEGRKTKGPLSLTAGGPFGPAEASGA